jgi:hypothetical protein
VPREGLRIHGAQPEDGDRGTVQASPRHLRPPICVGRALVHTRVHRRSELLVPATSGGQSRRHEPGVDPRVSRRPSRRDDRAHRRHRGSDCNVTQGPSISFRRLRVVAALHRGFSRRDPQLCRSTPRRGLQAGCFGYPGAAIAVRFGCWDSRPVSAGSRAITHSRQQQRRPTWALLR